MNICSKPVDCPLLSNISTLVTNIRGKISSGKSLLVVGISFIIGQQIWQWYKNCRMLHDAKRKTVFITGCDSGFGYETAKHLDKLGLKVFAGCYNLTSLGAADLQKICSNRLKVLHIDVTQVETIVVAFEKIIRSIDNQDEFCLINNAGILFQGEISATANEIYKKAFNTNCLGAVAVTRIFLPLVRKTKGRVVFVTSISGRIAMPMYSAYCMSKFALEAFADALRIEEQETGIAVIIIEPTGFKTGALSKAALEKAKHDMLISLQKETSKNEELYFSQFYDMLNTLYPQLSSDVSPVVEVIRQAVLLKNPACRYQAGRGCGTLLALSLILPTFVMDKLIAKFIIGRVGNHRLVRYNSSVNGCPE